MEIPNLDKERELRQIREEQKDKKERIKRERIMNPYGGTAEEPAPKGVLSLTERIDLKSFFKKYEQTILNIIIEYPDIKDRISFLKYKIPELKEKDDDFIQKLIQYTVEKYTVLKNSIDRESLKVKLEMLIAQYVDLDNLAKWTLVNNLVSKGWGRKIAESIVNGLYNELMQEGKLKNNTSGQGTYGEEGGKITEDEGR